MQPLYRHTISVADGRASHTIAPAFSLRVREAITALEANCLEHNLPQSKLIVCFAVIPLQVLGSTVPRHISIRVAVTPSLHLITRLHFH